MGFSGTIEDKDLECGRVMQDGCGQALHVAWQNAGDFLDRIKKEEETLFLSWFDESVRTHIPKLRLVSWTDVRTNHGAFREHSGLHIDLDLCFSMLQPRCGHSDGGTAPPSSMNKMPLSD